VQKEKRSLREMRDATGTWYAVEMASALCAGVKVPSASGAWERGIQEHAGRGRAEERSRQ
jgi:hypothetical protein